MASGLARAPIYVSNTKVDKFVPFWGDIERDTLFNSFEKFLGLPSLFCIKSFLPMKGAWDRVKETKPTLLAVFKEIDGLANREKWANLEG